MSEQNSEITPDETPVNQQKIAIGLSPMGGIGINVTSTNGDTAGALLSIEEAEQLSVRIQNLAGIQLHMQYQEMAQQQMEAAQLAERLGVGPNKKPGLYVPGRSK